MVYTSLAQIGFLGGTGFLGLIAEIGPFALAGFEGLGDLLS